MKVRNKHNREMIVDLGEQWEPESSGIEEVWRDVSEECRVDDYSNRSGDFWSILHAPTGANVMSKCNDGYRLRKVQAYQVGERAHVFVVEQKVKS